MRRVKHDGLVSEEDLSSCRKPERIQGRCTLWIGVAEEQRSHLVDGALRVAVANPKICPIPKTRLLCWRFTAIGEVGATELERQGTILLDNAPAPNTLGPKRARRAPNLASNQGS